MRSRLHLITLALLLNSLHFFAAFAMAQGLPERAVENQARSSFVIKGQPATSFSNIARAFVIAATRLEWGPAQQLEAVPGQEFTVVHPLRNGGGDDLEFVLAAQAPGLEVLAVYRDLNRNGQIDATEQTIQSLVLPAGESASLISVLRVPNSAAVDASLAVRFAAVQRGVVLAEVTDQIRVVPQAMLEIGKSTLPGCNSSLFAGDAVTETIQLENTGSIAPMGSRVWVGGDRIAGFVVAQPVPASMRFVDLSHAADAGVNSFTVVHLSGRAANSWQASDAQFDLANIDSVGLFVPANEFDAGSQAQFTVRFEVLNILPENTISGSRATVDYNGDGLPDQSSDEGCYSFARASTALELALRFLQPAPSLRENGAVPSFDRTSDFSDALQFSVNDDGSIFYLPHRDGVYLELSIAGIDQARFSIDAAGRRYFVSELKSELSGDVLRVILAQTEQSNIYRSVAPIVLSRDTSADGATCPRLPQAGEVLDTSYRKSEPNCVLLSGSGDRLIGEFSDQRGLAGADAALVSPQGQVFNAQTRMPVAGAVVSVHRVSDGQLVVDDASGVAVSVETGADGRYGLPRLPRHEAYYLNVVAPPAHVFPSTVEAHLLAEFMVQPYSYGLELGSFKVDVGSPFVPPDIPLDSAAIGGVLSVDKSASISVVEPGQSLRYEISLQNHADEPVSSVVLEDHAPFGFRYITGTTQLLGAAHTDPSRGADGQLIFELGDLAAGASLRLSYAMRASAAAHDGDGVNMVRAVAVSSDNAALYSNESRVRVALRRTGVLSERASIFGKVYVDENCNAIQDDEVPLGGIRLYLEDGTYAVTDGDGMYSLYGLSAGLHVIKVDPWSLPQGLQLKMLDTNQAADPQSRFVDLVAGDFYRANFAAECLDESEVDKNNTILAAIRSRNADINDGWVLRSVESFNSDTKRPELNLPSLASGEDGDLSNGVLDGPDDFDDAVDLEQRAEQLREILDAHSTASRLAELPASLNPKELVGSITAAQAKHGTWLWPTTNISTNGRFVAVVRDGIDPVLYVNDGAVSASHIGERLVNRREGAQIVAWYGVELGEGDNRVEIRGVGPFGNTRVLAGGDFQHPASASKLRLSVVSDETITQAGLPLLPVDLELLDAAGLPALGVYFVTLESSEGRWVEKDIQDAEPGLQVRVSNGRSRLHFLARDTQGEVELRASTASFSHQIEVQNESHKRPLIATGLVDMGIGVSSGRFGHFKPSRRLTQYNGLSARTGFFASGRIRNGIDLTLSYDSRHDAELLRDIDPAMHYPIHGDASIRGYQAQSRSKLYLRMQRDGNSLLWGDFLTDSATEYHSLAANRRALTGLSIVAKDDQHRLRAFVAPEENRRVIEEQRGNGSALDYRLRRFPIVTNSETIELITRSRENPGLVIAHTRLSRFGDYTLDPEHGFLSFSSVIPSFDINQNPVYLRISYDVSSNADEHYVMGARYDRKQSDSLQYGFSFTNDQHPRDGGKLYGGFIDYKHDQNTRIQASVAGSERLPNGSGHAIRISAERSWAGRPQARTSLTYARADEKFSNADAAIAAGRSELRLTHRQQLDKHTKVDLTLTDSKSTESSDKRRAASIAIERQRGDWRFNGGVRHIDQSDTLNSAQFVTFLLGAERTFTIGERAARATAQYEQSLDGNDRNRLQLGTRWQLHEKLALYSNFERAQSLLGFGGFSLNQRNETLTVGIESSALPSTRMYSEYRMRGAFDGRDYETASGIRGDYEIEPNLRITPALEVIRVLDSNPDNNSIATSLGFTDTRSEISRKSVRIEWRKQNRGDYLGLRANYASRVSDDWTLLASENLSLQDDVNAGDKRRHSLLLGMSRRPRDNDRYHSLWQYNWKEERGIDQREQRSVHLVSTLQNLQVDESLIVSGRLGGKRENGRDSNAQYADFALLADGRLSFDTGSRVNLDFHGGVLSSGSSNELRYAFGAGVSYLLADNFRIGLDYNLIGFREEDLDTEEYNEQGLRFGMQFKFDEDSLQWLQ